MGADIQTSTLSKMSSAAKESINEIIDPKTGEMNRPAAQFRNFISSTPGAQFPPEKGRYHLYVSYACPWGELAINHELHLSWAPNNFQRTEP